MRSKRPGKPAASANPFWVCPICGRQFVSANKYHSCGRYELADHFAGKDPAVRALFDELLGKLEPFGPVSVHPVKTRIVFQSETQFAVVEVRRRWLEGTLWLRRRAAHPLIRRVQMQVYRDYGHIFRLTQPDDMDDAFMDLLHEAYVVACQPVARRG